MKDKTNFLVGQYDFDADDIDELIIAIQDNDDAWFGGLTINVFKLNADTWNRIGKLSQNFIVTPTAEFNMNKVTMIYHFRGFYKEWRFEGGRFKLTNDG
ncbi:hypothetical protein AGMMS50239_16790 [Bacteroidia bacterium]|nr:hypothetical protein AGMMS50239_16790 [Bacteroidia bacterium]